MSFKDYTVSHFVQVVRQDGILRRVVNPLKFVIAFCPAVDCYC